MEDVKLLSQPDVEEELKKQEESLKEFEKSFLEVKKDKDDEGITITGCNVEWTKQIIKGLKLILTDIPCTKNWSKLK